MPPRDKFEGKQNPPGECIGAGRIEGWFANDHASVQAKGFGYVRSFCFDGDLFFHLKRSPSLRGVEYDKRAPMTFEVIEYNGQVECCKVMLPGQDVAEWEMDKVREADSNRPDPTGVIGQRVAGTIRSPWQVVERQSWGFVGSEMFSGHMFWHQSDNPDMIGLNFERDDLVEFDICSEDAPNSKRSVRAKNMKYIERAPKDELAEMMKSQERPPKKLRKKKEMWNETQAFINSEFINQQSGPPAEGQPLQLGTDYTPSWSEAPKWQQAQQSGGWGAGNQAASSWGFDQNVQGRIKVEKPAWEANQNQSWQGYNQQPIAAWGGAQTQGGSVQSLMGRFYAITKSGQGESDVSRQVDEFVGETNRSLGDDYSTKKELQQILINDPWFSAHGKEVHYLPSTNTLSVATQASFASAMRGSAGKKLLAKKAEQMLGGPKVKFA